MRKYIPFRRSERPLLPHSRAAGPVDLSQPASLTIRVRSAGDVKTLEQRVHAQSMQPLKERKYLTRDELAETYGASAADLDLVERVAQRHNLQVAHRSRSERSIVLKGKLGDLLDAFPTELHTYHHPLGTYRGRVGPIHMPEELADVVTGIFGFDTRPRHRSPHRERSLAKRAGPGGDNGVSAGEFAKRYDFPTSMNGTTLDGDGQTIAIIELGGGYRASDLKDFFNEVGVPLPNVSSISADHAGNAPSNADSADGEVMLDIEVAGVVAPRANIAVYFAPNDGDKGFIDAISAAVHDGERNPSVISISWGGPEMANDQQGMDAFHEMFVAAAALGITVCVASGDHGTADLSAKDWDGNIHVDHPACDDMVLACGGTQINALGLDVAWNDGTPFDVNVPGGGGWAGGGGISQTVQRPGYQMTANLPDALNGGKPGRGVPDIAMSATNYFTRVDGLESASGGTSAVAPLMSALIALLNQAKQKRVGFINPFLYANSTNGVVHDVTSGTNAINGTVDGYTAGPGWDACTGLGTPDGAAILAKI